MESMFFVTLLCYLINTSKQANKQQQKQSTHKTLYRTKTKQTSKHKTGLLFASSALHQNPTKFATFVVFSCFCCLSSLWAFSNLAPHINNALLYILPTLISFQSFCKANWTLPCHHSYPLKCYLSSFIVHSRTVPSKILPKSSQNPSHLPGGSHRTHCATRIWGLTASAAMAHIPLSYVYLFVFCVA